MIAADRWDQSMIGGTGVICDGMREPSRSREAVGEPVRINESIAASPRQPPQNICLGAAGTRFGISN